MLLDVIVKGIFSGKKGSPVPAKEHTDISALQNSVHPKLRSNEMPDFQVIERKCPSGDVLKNIAFSFNPN